MNEQPNVPMTTGAGGMSAWFSVWMDALTKPNEQTFVNIANSGNAKASTAYLWVFIGSLVNLFFASLVQGAIMQNMLQSSGIDMSSSGGGFGTTLITAICGAPIVAAISVLFFAAFTGIVQWIAKMFGGRGTFDQLAYVLAAVVTPFSLISAILTLLSAIPFVGACFGIVGLVASLYLLVLQIMAVKGVNQFGWGQAAGSFLLPGFVLFCCVMAGVIGIMQALGPMISDTFNSINQSLAP